jgi:hypothetical protein
VRTPFQTHCYPENLVEPGIEPGISGTVKYAAFVCKLSVILADISEARAGKIYLLYF